MYWSQIAHLAHAGWEIASHSRDHRSIGNDSLKGPYSVLSAAELRDEICGSRVDLEVRYFPSPVTFIRPGNPNQNPLTERDMALARSCFSAIRLYNGNTPAKPSFNEFQPGSLQGLMSTHLRSYGELLSDVEELLASMGSRDWVIFAVHGVGHYLGGSVTITPDDFQRVLALIHKAQIPVLTLKEAMTALNRQSSD